MYFLSKKANSVIPKWNTKPLTESDFYSICRKAKITVEEMPLVTNGFYYCVLGRHYIAIDSRLKQPKKLFVMFHELAHYLMHSPDSGATANFHGVGKRTKKEKEADIFALCCLLPVTMIRYAAEKHEPVDCLGLDAEMLAERMQVFADYNI